MRWHFKGDPVCPLCAKGDHLQGAHSGATFQGLPESQSGNSCKVGPVFKQFQVCPKMRFRCAPFPSESRVDDTKSATRRDSPIAGSTITALSRAPARRLQYFRDGPLDDYCTFARTGSTITVLSRSPARRLLHFRARRNRKCSLV